MDTNVISTWLQAGFSCALAVGAWVGVACAYRDYRDARRYDVERLAAEAHRHSQAARGRR